ncbi:hypothetical protein ABEF95_006779 [Exophiala dermatitidis]
MGRKSSSSAVAKTSSASAPSVSTGTASAQKSSVLRSAFAPSNFQLHLFASVIQNFDSHLLRIHDIDNGRLRCQHETRHAEEITCLDWGYYGVAFREQRQSASKKKRKREQDNLTAAVIAYGTTNSEIHMFSPSEGKIVGTLSGVHEKGIKDFKFSPTDYLEAWSIGGDGKLVQWDLSTNQAKRTINLPDPAISVLASPSQTTPQILCASSTPFAIELKSSDDFRIDRYDSFKNPVHSLVRSGDGGSQSQEHFIAADSDRYLNVYDISQKRLVRTLVAGAGVVEVDLSRPSQDTPELLKQQILCAVLKDGAVELFPRPFGQPKQVNGDLKSSRKNMTQKASASVRLLSPGSTKHVPIVAASLRGPDLIIASADGGVDLAFQKIRWQDEGNGELLFDGLKEVVKVKGASTLNSATLNGVKNAGKSHVDESKTVVVNGAAGGPLSNAIEISSSESEAEDEDDEEEEEDEAEKVLAGQAEDEDEGESSAEESDEEMAEAPDAKGAAEDEDMSDDDTAADQEPTFGELLFSKHPHEISIASALPQDSSSSRPTVKNGQPVIPSGMSLGTVLTQALRTNDQSLLEACLHTLDINIVKNTIQRLDSGLAGILLSKLAERLASRPGRYGHLITWVQWTCIAHGGAIAAQPDVAAKLRTLYQVLTQRSKTLDNLLLLKGKLDMLDAQLSYRKQLVAQRPVRRDDQDEPGMIYIEGADNWDSEEDDDLDEDGGDQRPKKRSRVKSGKKSLEDLVAHASDEDDEDVDMLEDGAEEEESEEEEDEDEDEDEDEEDKVNGGLVDVEAEVSSAEDSDPDDHGDGGPENQLSSDDEDVSSSGSDDDADEDEAEDDSEMDSFINDGSIDFDEEEDDVHVPGDSEPEEDERKQPAPTKTTPKQSKQRPQEARSKQSVPTPSSSSKKPKRKA